MSIVVTEYANLPEGQMLGRLSGRICVATHVAALVSSGCDFHPQVLVCSDSLPVLAFSKWFQICVDGRRIGDFFGHRRAGTSVDGQLSLPQLHFHIPAVGKVCVPVTTECCALQPQAAPSWVTERPDLISVLRPV